MQTNINSVQTKENFYKEIKLSAGKVIILQSYQLSYLKDNPLNIYFYNPKVDFSPKHHRFVALVKSLKKEFKTNKQHGNTETIVITKNGYILSGHRRAKGAIVAGVPVRVLVVDEIYDENNSVEKRKNQLLKYNKNKETERDEKSFEALVYMAVGYEKLLKKEDVDIGDRAVKELVKQFILDKPGVDYAAFREAYRTSEDFKRPDLVKLVDEGKLSTRQAINKAKDEKKGKEKINPEQFNWKDEFESKPELSKTITSEFKRFIKFMDSYETRSGKKWTDNDFGFEISPTTTTLSHSLMMIVTDAIREHTSIDVYTAAHGGGGTPDISSPGLSKIAKDKDPLHADEALEIKGSASDGFGGATFYGGPAFKMRVHRDWYILFVTESKATRFMIMLVQVQPDDVKGADGGRKTCSLQHLMKNHYDKKDYYMIAGDVYSTGKGKFNIEYEKVSE